MIHRESWKNRSRRKQKNNFETSLDHTDPSEINNICRRNNNDKVLARRENDIKKWFPDAN